MTDTDPYLSTLTLATALLERASLTPDDAGCLDLIAARLSSLGFACERVDRNGVGNLWARLGAARPLACVAGHVDVVPPGPVEQWASAPFAPTARGARLYARGASDMKGPLAAALTAIERLARRKGELRGSLAVLVTSDEEGDAVDGTRAVVDRLVARGERLDYCLLAEPTSGERLGDTIKNGRRGSLNGRLTVRGAQCHIAYPHLGSNPIHALAPALAELVAIEWDRGTEYFPPTSFQVSNIHAGTGAVNVIPGELSMRFNIRFSPATTVEHIQTTVKDVLDRHGVPHELAWSVSGLPFITPRGTLTDALVHAVQVETGVTPSLSTTGGTSDGRFLAAVSDQVVEFGPSNDSIHQIDESILLADLGPLSRIYERTLAALLTAKA